ncbi:MAG: porin family protein [Gammaproteobacteria bacterium]|nr:porin family protein [Gammaproteobacteria bacterium]
MMTHSEKYKPAHHYQLQTLALVLLLASFSPRLAAQSESSIAIEFDLSKIYFEDEVFRGDTAHLGLSLAYAINPAYEIGYSYSDNLFFTPSLDGGPELDELEDMETEVNLLYLRRYWKVGDKTSVFGQIGYAKTEIKTEFITSVCLFFCGGIATFDSSTTYRNEQSGFAWGIGMQQRLSNVTYWSLRYIDYSSSGLDFSGIHLGFRQTFGL